MKLKKVIPDMGKTFGNLEYAGEGDVKSRRINGQSTVASREFHLFSDVQRADDVIVRIPGKAGMKGFDFGDSVTLVNPRIVAGGRTIGRNAFVDFVLEADDMEKVKERN